MLVFNIPHSSTYIPSDCRDQFVLSDAELRAELVAMTDHYTDELFEPCANCHDSVVKARVSRLVVDTERFEDDAAEPMSLRGMGAVYQKTSTARSLRRLMTSLEREQLLDRFFRPHHEQLETAASYAIESTGRVLIVDCHSFPAKPLPYEVVQHPDRPDICVGTDDFHTPNSLSEILISFLRSKGYVVAVNTPFAGTIVPMSHYRKDRRVSSIMIEINRRLYLKDFSAEKTARFAQVSMDLDEGVELLRREHKLVQT